MLAQDLQALAFLRFPQFPSSRKFGSAAAISTWEYRTLVPNDPTLAWAVIVVGVPTLARLWGKRRRRRRALLVS
jgi:hypothetical protein